MPVPVTSGDGSNINLSDVIFMFYFAFSVRTNVLTPTVNKSTHPINLQTLK
jgi:hypothetical protein